MKKGICIRICNALAIILIAGLVIVSCRKVKNVPEEYVGDWVSPMTEVTVRTEEGKDNYEFISDSVIIVVRIHEDGLVDGSIGTAAISDKKLLKNRGNPDNSGIIYIVKCDLLGKFFESDPLYEKETELWICPLNNEGLMEIEVRYTDGFLTAFPMAGAMLNKH